MSFCMIILSRHSPQRHAQFSSKDKDKRAALYYSTFHTSPYLQFALLLFLLILYTSTLHAVCLCLGMFDFFVMGSWDRRVNSLLPKL
jgi:hypothetical protein